MNAKKMGSFIAERREELGLTQALLAEKLNITEKAVAKWEKGADFPDLNRVEDLAEELDVSLLELMQARRSDKEKISTQDAEQVIRNAIQLSKPEGLITKKVGGIILLVFCIIVALLLWLFLSNGETVAFAAGSIIAGLIAWGIPIAQIAFVKAKKVVGMALASVSFALVSIMIQFFQIANNVHNEDFAAIEDTIDALLIVIMLFCVITFVLNIIMAVCSAKKNKA